MEFRLRPRAISDLESIWNYSVETWDEEQAERYLQMINENFLEISKNPERGRKCDSVRRGYRRMGAGRHLVFYRIASFGIDIVRVLHHSMDVERHLYVR